MLRFQWNALRQDDTVLVHDPDSPSMELTHGVVKVVESRPGTNSVAIRLDAHDAEGRIVRPVRFAVHLGATDDVSDCWRCSALAQAHLATAAPPR
jgi:hypothetical protein